MNALLHSYGGDWTTDKLKRVRKYLEAYARIMSQHFFRFAYIDAFAGTGYRALKQDENPKELMLPEFAEKEAKDFLEGSARIALQIKPSFTKYIFIEKDEKRFAELEKLKNDFPEVREDIILINAEANAYIKDLCQNYKWARNRAVLFLDPFGMQVIWETIEAIAETKAIDLWYLFPLGVAVNRLLRRNGEINEPLKIKLDKLFGTQDWYESFYQKSVSSTLFGESAVTEKIATYKAIGNYFVARLKKIFPGVAENPLPLLNSKNNPLYLLCFASANPRGAKTAIKIAQDILKG
ncbi:MAG: three-Cys-motif partner protein TcmP [Thermodesulfobacteriota bacterium]|nr:three-Cys-motif partner protein TcmP [Thermodesulfobacteriota bacterium]